MLFLVSALLSMTGLGTLAMRKSTASGGGAFEIGRNIIKINGSNITNRTDFNIAVDYHTASASSGIKPGMIAPGAIFDIPLLIDTTKAEMDVEYSIALDANNAQFELLDIDDGYCHQVSKGNLKMVIATIRWNGTGDTNSDKELQGQNIDIPITVETSELTSGVNCN